jgi:hypothetical protein
MPTMKRSNSTLSLALCLMLVGAGQGAAQTLGPVHPDDSAGRPRVAHIILAVTDSGSPSLTSYRRVILNVRAARAASTVRKPGAVSAL